jgi:hypothetical protein
MELFPQNFPDTYESLGHFIRYSNLKEIGQGGPEVGNLFIDDKIVGSPPLLFGGPLYIYKHNLFVPCFKKRFISSYFKICVIDLTTQSIKEIGGNERLVLISKVDDDLVFFYRAMPNLDLKSVPWK